MLVVQLALALAYWYYHLKRKRIPTVTDSMRGSYLGSEYTNSQIKEILNKKKLIFKHYSKIN